jgi:hypothetical protein
MGKLAPRMFSVVLAVVCALAVGGFSPSHAHAQELPLKEMPVFGSTGTSAFNGRLSITQLSLAPDGLRAAGRVTGFLGRQRISHTFSNIPVALFAEADGGETVLSSVAPLALSPDEPFVCDVLFLDLAPLQLDLLGLRLDLAEVVLDLDALSGPNNLVGNLLCAVTGLLDVVNLGVLLQGILESLLDAINSLL